MYDLLKIIHFLAMGAGVGLGVANMILGIRAAASEGPAIGALRMAQGAMGRVAFVAIALLWLTGLWLWFGYRDQPVDTVFAVKLAAVVVLTALSVIMNLRGMAAAKGGPPVDPAFARRVGMLMGLMSLIAVIAAVLVFG
jgi:hypothetical protein